MAENKNQDQPGTIDSLLSDFEKSLPAANADASSAAAVDQSLGAIGAVTNLLNGVASFFKAKPAPKREEPADDAPGKDAKDDDDVFGMDDYPAIDGAEKGGAADRIDISKGLKEKKSALEVTAFLDGLVNDGRAGMAALAKRQTQMAKSLAGRTDGLAVQMREFMQIQTAVNTALVKSLETITKQQEAFFSKQPVSRVNGMPAVRDLNLKKLEKSDSTKTPPTKEQLFKAIQDKKITYAQADYIQKSGQIPEGVTLD